MTPRTFRSDDSTITVYLDGPEWDSHPTAAIGNVKITSDHAGRDVLNQAISFIRSKGVANIIGPMDGDTWHSYRLVTQTDNSPAFFMEPENNPLALSLLKSGGFAEISAYFSARVPLSQTGLTTPPLTEDFRIEPWDGTEPEHLFTQVYELSVQAFSGNPFYKTIKQEEFLEMYLPLVPMLKQELIFFARRPDRTLAGFLFGIPNYAEGSNPRTVILKTYASRMKGAGRHLAYAFHKAAVSEGYETAIHALIYDDNLSALRSATEGATVFRRYGLFGMKLNDWPAD